MTRSNSPAFPQLQTSLEKQTDAGKLTEHLVTTGLTKRELFAAIMMQTSIIANALVNKEVGALNDHVQDAIDSADALIAELERTENQNGCSKGPMDGNDRSGGVE